MEVVRSNKDPLLLSWNVHLVAYFFWHAHPGSVSYITLCFKSRSLECASRFSYLSQNRFWASLTDRKNSCGGRVGCALKYSGAWYGIRRRRAKNASVPSTPGNCRYYNYLFIPGARERWHTRHEKACCMIEHSTYANTRIESMNFMYYTMHSVLCYACAVRIIISNRI